MNGWTETENQLKKTFEFSSFQEAMQWMSKAIPVIEEMNHHPEWTNVYNKVHVVLRTHSAGNTVTPLDRKLAMALDAIQ